MGIEITPDIYTCDNCGATSSSVSMAPGTWGLGYPTEEPFRIQEPGSNWWYCGACVEAATAGALAALRGRHAA